jgi:excisionase family DNA binding protein
MVLANPNQNALQNVQYNEGSMDPQMGRKSEGARHETSLPMNPSQIESLNRGEHMPARMLTLREVSDYLHVNPATVRRLVRRGQLRAIRVGRDLRFEVRVVDQWVAAGGSIARESERRETERMTNGDSGVERKTSKS